MLHASYLIVGAGMAADAAVRGIRDVDPDGSIILIGDEHYPPYKRPPLSKGLWHGKPLERIWSRTERHIVDLHLGRSARWLDLHAKQIVDDRGTTYGFDKLLIATGSRPRRLATGGHRIIHFRTLHDYRRLRDLARHAERIAVVGNGFIGTEIAAALAANGTHVTMVFPAAAIGARLFPPDLAAALNDLYRDQGVEVLPGHLVSGVAESGDQITLRVRDLATDLARDLTVDGVVAGIGTEPNVELAVAAGLAVDDGIVVDEFLRTSHPDVYAAGDVAAPWLPSLGLRRRVEHEDAARSMGRFAGRAMAGQPAPYDRIPFFYSDLFHVGYEAVGEIDARLETVAEWTVPYREGVVYYHRDQRVRGVLNWNVWNQVDAARALVAEGAPVPAAGVPARELVAG